MVYKKDMPLYTGITNTKDPFIKNLLIKQLKKLGIKLMLAGNRSNLIPLENIQFIMEDPIYKEFPFNQYKGVCKISIIRDPNDIKLQKELLDKGSSSFIFFPTTAEIVAQTIKNATNLTKNRANILKLNQSQAIYSQIPFPVDSKLSIVQDITDSSVFYLKHENNICKISLPEKNVLQFLIKTGSVVTSKRLVKIAWPFDSYKSKQHLSWLIRRIRNKLSKVNLNYKIINLYGYGYYLTSSINNDDNKVGDETKDSLD